MSGAGDEFAAGCRHVADLLIQEEFAAAGDALETLNRPGRTPAEQGWLLLLTGLLSCCCDDDFSAVEAIRQAHGLLPEYAQPPEALAVLAAVHGRRARAFYYGKLAATLTDGGILPVNVVQRCLKGSFETAVLFRRHVSPLAGAIALRRQGLGQRALEWLRTYLALYPDTIEAWEMLADILAEQHRCHE